MSNNRKRTRQKFLIRRRNLNRAILRKRIKEALKNLYKTRQEFLRSFENLKETARKAAEEFLLLRECSGGLNHDNPGKR